MSGSNFEATYVRSNLRADVPDYDEGFIDTLREHIVASDQGLAPISEAVLVGRFDVLFERLWRTYPLIYSN